jgi:hypothetical protein
MHASFAEEVDPHHTRRRELQVQTSGLLLPRRTDPRLPHEETERRPRAGGGKRAARSFGIQLGRSTKIDAGA